MAQFIWTNHARERLNDRRVPDNFINQTLSNPDRTFEDGQNTKLQKKFDHQTVTIITKRNDQGQFLILSCWIDPPFPGTSDYKSKKRYLSMKKASMLKKFWFTFLNQLGL